MTNTGIAALNEGARRVLRVRKLIVLFYAVNLIAAALVVAPAAMLIQGRLAHSLDSDRLFGNLDVAWIAETLYPIHWWPVNGIGVTLAITGLLYLLLNTFLAGGALAVLQHDNKAFFSTCAHYFFRLLRLMLMSLIFYALVAELNRGIGWAIHRGSESSMEARPWTIAHWIQLLLAYLLFGSVNLLFDFAKIVCIAGGQRSAIRAIIGAFRFLRSHAGRTLAVYWISAAIGLAFLLAYHGITEATGQDSPVAICVVFVVRQIYMLARMWLRLWTWSSELQLYTFNSTIVAPEPPSLAAAG